MKAIHNYLLHTTVIVLVLCLGSGQARAADAIDLSQPCSLTLFYTCTPGTGEDPDMSDLGDASQVCGKLYRVADVALGGEYCARSPFEPLEIPSLSAPDRESWAALWEETAIKAAAIVEASPEVKEDAAITLTALPEGSGIRGSAGALTPGMYLILIEDVLGTVYAYRFRPFLVAIPGNLYWQSRDESMDAWIYDVSAALKPEWERRDGELVIRKTVERYGEINGGADFVFLVESRDAEGTLVYSNVVTIRHQDAGTQETVLTGIPAGLTVTVTEVYSGTSYTLVSEPSQSATVTTPESGLPPARVEFVNTWNGKLTPDTAVVNRFSYSGEEPGWKWEPLRDNNTAS